MSSLYLLIPIAGIFCAIALLLLRWAVNNGQYEDLERESWRILQDADNVKPAESNAQLDETSQDPNS